MNARVRDECDEFCFKPAAVKFVKKHRHPEDEIRQMAEMFKILGDRTRLRILDALTHKELCVCDISVALDMNISAVSQQLRILRTARLVKSRRDGKNIFYSLDDDHVVLLFRQVLHHVKHQ